jgi:hypothetical protein
MSSTNLMFARRQESHSAAAPDAQTIDEQPVSDGAAARRLRLDHRCALVGGAAAVCGIGYAAGQLARPWTHLMPDTPVWAVAGGPVAGAVMVVGAVGVWRWRSGWWPYRHNRVLGTAAGGAE